MYCNGKKSVATLAPVAGRPMVDHVLASLGAIESIDEAFYQDLARYYSVEEIVELGLFIGFNVGFHVFFGTLDFYPMFTPDGHLVSQEESRRIYGTKPVSLASGLDVGAGPEADQ
mgnify:CR=1 FL=1